VGGEVFLIILESLGSTELFFILLMALIFFGPRKLPQLSRSLGKNLAEFRKASEDFKRTWEKEVALEDIYSDTGVERAKQPEGKSILNPAHIVEPALAEQVVARQTGEANSGSLDLAARQEKSADSSTEPAQSEPLRKQDWL
jgi:TatA/E family protein of Tat protein translocase